MAARGWAGSTVVAMGIAAGAGAAQLGVGYGLGIVAWLPAQDQAGKVIWQASLAWVVWIAATSTVIGAAVAHWLSARADPGEPAGFLRVMMRLTLALAAAVGALVIVPLVAVPARAAESPQNFAPEWTAAGYAGVGVIVGLAVAVAALSVRAIAANVIMSVAYLWVLALFAVADGLRDGVRPLLVQLAIWKFTAGPTVRDFYVPGVLMMLAAAIIIGIAASWRAGRRGDSRIGVAISGAIGPLLVAAAYLLAAPQFAGNRDVDVSQWSAHLFAPYAVIAGLAGSVLVAAIGPTETPEERGARLARAAERRTTRDAERAAAREAKEVAARGAKEAKEVTARQAKEAKEVTARQAKEAKQQARAAGAASAGAKPVAAAKAGDDMLDWPGALSPERHPPDADTPTAAKPTGTSPTKQTGATAAGEGPSATPGTKPPATTPTSKAARPVPAHPDANLADDAYAPARAYRPRADSADPDATAYASDTGDAAAADTSPAKPGSTEAPPTGRAGGPAPLWPNRAGGRGTEGEENPPSGKGGRPRR
jgi:hypothetical protein